MPQTETPLSALMILGAVIAGGLAVWVLAALAWRRGRAVVPWARRRPVPWQGFHVALLFLLYAGLLLGLPPAMTHWLAPPEAEAQAQAAAPEAEARADAPVDTEHMVGRLLRESRDLGSLLVCVASAGILAPVCEEFLFRLVLQGWLENRERRLRRRALRLRVPRGAISVVTVAVIFAGIHFRTAAAAIDGPTMARYLLVASVVNLVTLAAGLLLLGVDARATAEDLGLVPRKLAADVGLGLAAFLAIAVVIYPLQVTLPLLLPRNIAPDPISLLPFALLVGILYCRTHRIVPSIVVHMGLNGTSLVLAWLQAGAT